LLSADVNAPFHQIPDGGAARLGNPHPSCTDSTGPITRSRHHRRRHAIIETAFANPIDGRTGKNRSPTPRLVKSTIEADSQ
jgi:hypothetical protein